MSYATAEELIAAVPDGATLVAQLTGTEEPDTDTIDRALADASAEIDSYLASRYPLPLETVPSVLRQKAVDIAVYRMMTLRPMGAIDDARERYKDAISWLKLLAEGKVSLGVPSNEPGAEADSSGGVAFVASPSVMSNLSY